jgi:hypothetical protein
MKAWEVQALLAGRKTQARLLMKPQPRVGLRGNGDVIGFCEGQLSGPEYHVWEPKKDDGGGAIPLHEDAMYRVVRSGPYGDIGDRIWCRESFWEYVLGEAVAYRADPLGPQVGKVKWRPSTQMPKWASRITIEIVNVRVERVQDISEADAIAEGMDDDGCRLAFRAAMSKEPKQEYARWLRLEDGTELPDAGFYCVDCADREVKKHKDAVVDGWNEHFSNDCVPFCESCSVMLCHSLTSYGIESELDHHEEHGPPSGYDAYVLAEVCSGMGDYLEEHKGRMAKVAYATIFDSINGPSSWDANPWVWCITFRKLEAQ